MAEFDVINKIFKLKLDNEKRKKIALKIKEDIDNALTASSDLRTRIDNWNKQYEGITTPTNFPWTNAANMHVPVTAIAVDAIHARLLGTIFNIEPIVLVKGKNREKAAKVQEILNYYWDVMMAFKEKIDSWVLKTLIEGTGVLKLIWKQEIKKTRTIEEIIPEVEVEILPIEGREPQYYIKEVEEIVYEGPSLEVIPLQDIIVPPRARSVEESKFIVHRFYLRWSDLKKRELEGIYDNIEEIKNKITEQYKREEVYRTIQETIGITETMENRFENMEFELYEYWGGYDINNDGIDEECIFTLESSTLTLIRADINSYLHGNRPFVILKIIPREGFFYGIGLCERLESLQAEINTVHNDRLNNQALAIAKIFKVRKGSGFDPTLQELYPGATIFLEDLNDLQILEMGDIKSSSFLEEPMLREYIERATGVTDYTLGMGGRYRTGRGTATGTLALLQEGNIRFDVFVERLRGALKKLAEMTIQLCQQFLPESIEIQKKILGTSEVIFEEISKEDIQGKYEYIPLVASRFANPIIDRQEKMQLYSLLSGNPLVSKDLRKIYNLTKEVLLSMNIKNYEDYIGTKEEIEAEIEAAKRERELLSRTSSLPGESDISPPPILSPSQKPSRRASTRKVGVPLPPSPPSPSGPVIEGMQ